MICCTALHSYDQPQDLTLVGMQLRSIYEHSKTILATFTIIIANI